MKVEPSTPSPATSDASVTPSRILLVGPQAIALSPVLTPSPEAAASPGSPEVPVLATAQNIIEAVLISGVDVADEPLLLVVDVAPEIQDLEAGVRSLRRVHPGSRIILLCDPGDEVTCRKARHWGADDYYILPLDHAGMRELLTWPVEPTQSTVAAPVKPAVLTEAPRSIRTTPSTTNDLASLPLIVQTELLEDLMSGRAEFAERAILSLARHLPLKGRLRFAAPSQALEVASAGQLRRTVSLVGQPPFGTLLYDPDPNTEASPALQAMLAQAAHWLAGMLSIALRYEQLRSLAITDELSGAYNRRYFTKYMTTLIERARENRFRVTLLLFDIDDFKRYNDTFGHASGDAIIRELIKLLRACTRPHDLVARIGGDEFAVVYWDNEAPRQPNSEHPKDVLAATERFREAIHAHQWPQTCNIDGEVSISGGLATFPWDADTLEQLMSKADAALLRAKAAGKNVIVMHGTKTAGAEVPTSNAQ